MGPTWWKENQLIQDSFWVLTRHRQSCAHKTTKYKKGKNKTRVRNGEQFYFKLKELVHQDHSIELYGDYLREILRH